jgi:hypothetical protein
MPTLSASEYTQYLKFKASAGSAIRPAIQTRDNVALSQSLINANLLASQAAFVTTPATTITSTLSATVSAVSTTTVTAARTDILSAAVGNGTIITYTSLTAYPHGLSNGDVVTITGFADFAEANVTDEEVTVVDSTTFTVAVAETGTATGAGSITNRVYYTTSVAHGLVAGDVISITGITTFTASNRTVVSAPSTTTFALTSATTGTAVSGATGSITGIVYYTTSAAHGLTAGSKYLTISGLTTTIAYNHTLATVFRAPSTTVFSLQSTATGTAITDQTGVLTLTTYPNQNMAVTGLARVQGPQVVQTRSNPDARSTVSYAGTSGALSSSRVQQPGGLPGGFKSSTSTYTRLPQQAGW